MHSGFGELRSTFGMNLEARLPEVGERMLREKPGAARDLKRIDAMWRRSARSERRSVPVRRLQRRRRLLRAGLHARAAPTRLPLSPRSAGYMRAHPRPARLPRVGREALAEHDFIAEDEPYRTQA